MVICKLSSVRSDCFFEVIIFAFLVCYRTVLYTELGLFFVPEKMSLPSYLNILR